MPYLYTKSHYIFVSAQLSHAFPMDLQCLIHSFKIGAELYWLLRHLWLDLYSAQPQQMMRPLQTSDI